MKLSEPRIRNLAKKIAREINSRSAVALPAGPEALAILIEKVLLIDQALETRIEEEARALLAKQRNLPPPGSSEYEAQFQQVKRNVATRKGFPL